MLHLYEAKLLKRGHLGQRGITYIGHLVVYSTTYVST